jgi:hypothetical protein
MQPNCSHKKDQELVWVKEKAKEMVKVLVMGQCILAVRGP